MGIRIEICVDTSAGLAEAHAGGANRIELCAALPLGGLTPSAGFMAEAALLPIPVLAMIRPRAGDFVFTPPEIGQMEADIATARTACLAGVVIGASLPDGRLDRDTLARLVRSARGLDMTLHRAFDMAPDLSEALETAIALGIPRVLTSGGAPTAWQGRQRIAALIEQAAGRIVVMPGSGIAAENAAGLAALGAADLHASCSATQSSPPHAVRMGFAPATRRQTSADLVRALRQAVD
ncbi:MAG: copper homeostasis protein CutC [Paracoccaceae bacterium]